MSANLQEILTRTNKKCEPPKEKKQNEVLQEKSEPPQEAAVSESTVTSSPQHSSPKLSTPPHRRAASLSPSVQRSDSVKFNKKPANGSAVRTINMEDNKQRTPRTSKRVPSLKLKRMGAQSRNLNTQNAADRIDSTMPCLPQCTRENPSITITIDSDDDSIYSDYLSPEINYKPGMKVQFIGDETSLYGTPKEELIPNSVNSVNMEKSSPTSFLREQIYAFFQPSDNKLAMKLFGNKNALLKEKARHKRQGNWVIHPCSNFR
ncbi:Potassium/sodium hyperpolarization-activated cyclic nucleotide-gated channel 3 [Mactra antiquata]